MKITVLAAGTWGTALAAVLSANHSVTIWSFSPEEAERLSSSRKHPNLPNFCIPESIVFTSDIEFAIHEAEIIIVATPSIYVRTTMEKIKPFVTKNQIIVSVAKGMEKDTLLTMSEIIDDVLNESNPVVALSGPTHAEEVAMNLPTLIVSSSRDGNAAKTVQRLFTGTCIRPYTNEDIVGIELCGAVKNIIALACGIATGLGYGDNTKAAIITRGLTEIRKLGRTMGCSEETFAGLAGVGDLIVTATSQHSRNNKAGFYIGQGMTAEQAIAKVGMVVEGIYALPAALALAEKYQIETPIINSVNDIVSGKISAQEAVSILLNRNMRSECLFR